MGDALRQSTGEKMKGYLASLSSTRYTAVLSGSLITAILQSSAVVCVMVVGFVSSGLMTLQSSLGILLGAGIGTTVTSHMVSVDITIYTMYGITVGFGMLTFGKTKRIQQWGTGLLGLGLVFFGLDVMSKALTPLRSYPPFISMLVSMSDPVLAILVCCIFTALIQSSTASVGIVIVLASQDLLNLKAAMYLIMGANIGTGVTPLLAAWSNSSATSLGGNREGQRVALANLIFKLGGLILVPILPLLLPLLKQTADELPRQIAIGHTLLNVVITFMFLPFLKQVGNLCYRMLPERKSVSIEVP
eukprot:TRINITY_DN19173_c0_g1_i1.p1 TRINITY_DN19173_c0_g1~~TRINITY_DN19173_c0_g1_i1.p1  ORF type:complete len:332 (+),score=41.14 TRINITY_DN19173_c0_g1_i1:89-997(+)